MNPAQARRIALSFAGSYEKSSYGRPAFFVGNKLFTQVNSHGSKSIMLLTLSFEERDHLLAADPKTFYITDHFRNYKGLLARTDRLDAKTFRALFERRWQAIAPKKLLAVHFPPPLAGKVTRRPSAVRRKVRS